MVHRCNQNKFASFISQDFNLLFWQKFLYAWKAAMPNFSFALWLCRHGVRNSLLLAPMPTASTAQILGNNESIEPYTSNIYTRRVLSGEFQVRHKSL